MKGGLKNRLKVDGFVLIIVAVTIIAFICRVRSCFWGAPLQLHTDEGAIVNYVVEMLQRHSWEAHSYDRPDHFEIKCNAILFTLVSWVRYHKSAYEAFGEHRMAFFVVARFFTTLFGTALIPLTSAYVGKLVRYEKKYRRCAQFISAVLVAFSTIFLQNSAYATPDIVLTFFVVFFALLCASYLNDGNLKALYGCMVVIGIGVTIKYPAAILCIPLAAVVIYYNVKKGDGFLIVRQGLISIGVIFMTIFVLAPNLITDIQTVYRNLIEEARTNHLGADGLGFLGNLNFYFEDISCNLGVETIILFFIGIIFMRCFGERSMLSILTGLIYWICISMLPLHWQRWGIPMYPFYIIPVAIGVAGLWKVLDERCMDHKIVTWVARVLWLCIVILLIGNVSISSAMVVKSLSLPDERLLSREFIDENGITIENSLYEIYTPFAPSGGGTRAVNEFLLLPDGTVKIREASADKQYFIMSNSLKDRYMAEPDRYTHECAIYEGIDKTYLKLYMGVPDGNYQVDCYMLPNVHQAIKYLLTSKTSTGVTITIYVLK